MMPSDIDQIIERLTAEFPSIHVRRLPVVPPTGGDGLWLLALPDRGTQVQIKSNDGIGPFLIESDLGETRFYVPAVPQAASIIRTLLL